MFKTGNIKKNIQTLESLVKKIKYNEKIDYSLIELGDPRGFLPLISYIFLNYSPYIAQLLLSNNYELFSKNDKDFIKTLTLALINIFNYKPTLSVDQFFKNGFAEAKIIFCSDVINLIIKENDKLTKLSKNKKPKLIENNKHIHDIFPQVKETQHVLRDEEEPKQENHFVEEYSYSNKNDYNFPTFQNNNFDHEENVKPLYNIQNNSNCQINPNSQSENNDYLENSQDELSSLVNTISDLALSIKEMKSKMDYFFDKYESRFVMCEKAIDDLKIKTEKLSAENMLLKNELLIERNKSNQVDFQNNTISSNKENNKSINEEYSQTNKKSNYKEKLNKIEQHFKYTTDLLNGLN